MLACTDDLEQVKRFGGWKSDAVHAYLYARESTPTEVENAYRRPDKWGTNRRPSRRRRRRRSRTSGWQGTSSAARSLEPSTMTSRPKAVKSLRRKGLGAPSRGRLRPPFGRPGFSLGFGSHHPGSRTELPNPHSSHQPFCSPPLRLVGCIGCRDGTPFKGAGASGTGGGQVPRSPGWFVFFVSRGNCAPRKRGRRVLGLVPV